jgi:ubiquinol oxidase
MHGVTTTTAVASTADRCHAAGGDDRAPHPPPRAAGGTCATSTHAALLAEQERTLASPRRRYSLGARVLFVGMDVLYGRRRSLEKFVVLELVARVPYQAWEHAAYVAITRHASDTRIARAIHDRVCRTRMQQDNEQWHLFILEDVLERDGVRLPWFRYRLLPQAIAWAYYTASVGLYLLAPARSYALNADFEDHAEHEYMAYVAEHPELDAHRCTCSVAEDYGGGDNLGDVLRQIALDERQHKLESLEELERLPRRRLAGPALAAAGAVAAGLAVAAVLR